MSWAKIHIEKLQTGVPVKCNPTGNSMTPIIKSGQDCYIKPLDREPVAEDIVLCRVKGNDYLHIIRAVKILETKTRYQIGNNHGGVNGWTGRNKIYGILTDKEEFESLMKNVATCGHCKKQRRLHTFKKTSTGYVCMDNVDCIDKNN